MLITGLIYLFIPTLLITVLAFRKQIDRLNWFLTVMLTGLAVLFIWTIARWEIVSIYFRPMFPILYILASIYSYTRIMKSNKPIGKIVSAFSIGLNIVIIFFMFVMNVIALRGYKVPAETIELASPLRNGKYIVLHGGSRQMVNAHFHVNPQNYAIDIVQLNRFGMRASSIGGGSNLNNYEIYGKPIYSPAKGKVIVVVDEFDDMIPPETDVENIAGNHILIDVNGKEILLAHLKKGSIKVKVGDLVDSNTVIAAVGNSGNTSEPHLHMHLEYGGVPNIILNGRGVAFTINGRFLLRGDIIDMSAKD